MMEAKRSLAVGNVWQADLENGMFQNPILHADYSDPDVIRVGKDYYMVSSSFHMSPCLPVLHSTDLVNWKIINHVADTLPFESYDNPRHGDGVWAPSLRYHEGRFWVFFGAPDEGIFMSTAEDPAGEWTPLHLVKKVKGWIDTCPFWDDDGQAYLVSAFAKSRIGFKSILHISRMKQDGTELLDEGIHVFDGNEAHPTIEGPKLYKRNGYYYIFAPAGGVATGWQTILRSKNIFGPYEDKIVLHQGNTYINGPHQGGWVETETGESWFLHFQDKGAYGRIVHLQPMEWENDWPVMGHNQNKQGIGEPVLKWEKPKSKVVSEIIVPDMSDDFSSGQLGLQWQWQANRKPHWYELKEQMLRLHAIGHPGETNLYHIPNILTQKFPAETFKVTTKLRFTSETKYDQTGLIVLGRQYASIAVRKVEEQLSLFYITGDEETLQNEVCVGKLDGRELTLRVEVEEGANCSFSYSEDGVTFQKVDEVFEATPGKWVGAQIGIYCYNSEYENSKGYAEFDYFSVHN
ncbi:glycoside hydrolase 43 family protein [Bacillus sp. JJ1566]|uniref:glycoside hydrolase family 43 protein n=1 Tax=Bacillus sp. JJ1566 TaxID=3122961 RepID=UPI002FFDAAF0